jgi:hypothetical protein
MAKRSGCGKNKYRDPHTGRCKIIPNRIKGWKTKEQWRNGWSSNGTQVHVFPGIQKGKHEVHIWETHPYKDVLIRRTFSSKEQAKNYAKRWMLAHPNG